MTNIADLSDPSTWDPALDAVKAAPKHHKVIFENDYLPSDEIKILLCEICERVGAEFVKTSTGFGFVKQKDGNYNYKGATPHDLKLMRANCGPGVQVKAAGGVRTFEEAARVRELGVTRIGASATEAIVAGERAANGQKPGSETTVESVGY